jgi:ABC-type branched-subunit amino acid transport system ATPase component
MCAAPRRLRNAEAVAQRVGLAPQLDKPASDLTVAGRKRLELARALATRPRLLLLDEVLAGLNPQEIAEMMPVVRGIADSGVTVLMIEHVMQAVMNLAEHVWVLAQGQLIAEGNPAQVTSDDRVVEAYLGHGTAARLRKAAPKNREREHERAPSAPSKLAPQCAARRSNERVAGHPGLRGGYGRVEVLRGVDLQVNAGRDGRAARQQRRGQVHAEQDGLRPGARMERHRALRRQGPERRALPRRGQGRPHPGARRPQGVPQPERAGEPGARLLHPRPRTRAANVEKMFHIFPRLRERMAQHAGTMSGGEQQMLAIARGLMAEPVLLILDEPSLGLSPLLVEEMFG